MKLIVGLGNPGKEFQNTRHNIGFMVIDQFAVKCALVLDQRKFNALYSKTRVNGVDVIIMKPQTYMNLSGEAVSQLADFYRIEVKDILVVYDDFDLPLGKLRLREKGTGGSHNGMKNIVQQLKTTAISRLRIGIDKNPLIEQKDYVLGKFNPAEQKILEPALKHAADALWDYLNINFVDLMTKYNTEHDKQHS
ncbi:Peptidyl-tRNA hydrolase [bioreactor metagenome]|uniref:peptidyl-tRNA hydrolase n=1 Tax=bioreactor metagenome TaxID=1076179 RepID=A0A644XSK7_9ZZZZ|nr:aminoacyl-tRNA hydrolase [Erysipelotrichaceae bacterium]